MSNEAHPQAFRPGHLVGATYRAFRWSILRRAEGHWCWATNKRGGVDRWWHWEPLPVEAARGRWRAIYLHDGAFGEKDPELLASGPRWWCELQSFWTRVLESHDHVVIQRNRPRRWKGFWGYALLASLFSAMPFLVGFISGRGIPHE
jgi:hypothetical protein